MDKATTKIEVLIEERRELMAKLLQMEEIKRDIETVDRLLAKYGYNYAGSSKEEKEEKSEPTALIIPTEYNPHFTWEDKCLFILSSFGALYASEVAEKIKELEPDIDLEKAEGRCSHSLSKLFREKKINVIAKSGKRFKYSL